MNPTNPTDLPIEPIVGTVRFAGGTRLEDGAPCAVALTPPPRAARGREDERLFILLDLTGLVSPHLYRELREVVAQTYWSTTGSITAALRQGAAAVNRYLFDINLHASPSDRCDGGLICAVLHGDDLFILQAGSCRACFFHGEHLECFSYDEDLAPLGMGRLADVRLHHVFVAPGDALLLASPALIREVSGVGLARVLSRAGMHEVLEGLEQVGAGVDFVALLVRWAVPGESPAEALAARETPRPLFRLRRRPLRPRARPEPAREPGPGLKERTDEAQALPVSPRPRREPPRPRPRTRPEPARKPGPGLGERMGRAVRSVGRGVAATGAWLAGGVGTLFRRMLPGPRREARRRARPLRPRPARPVPSENHTVMMVIAVGIPVVLAIVVALAYLSFGATSRFQDLINQTEEEITLAQTAGGISEGSRSHWEAALEHANAAAALRPDDPVAAALQVQTQAALDRLDGIARLQSVQLWDFGPGASLRQLVIHGQMIFVLDPAGGWVARLTLNPNGDGVVEQGAAPILVQTGQQVGEGEVGSLVDFVWVNSGGERQTSGLLILEEDGALLSYDPAWEGEGGAPQLRRSYLGTPPHSPRVVGSFNGRFYVLDTAINQIRRYEPRGDTYPERPDHYYVSSDSLPRSLADARDMAIDGYIYILYADGAILKFSGGELESFDVHGLPGDLSQAIALAVDPDGSSGAVYVADQGNRRVIVLGPDGTFQAQFRADEAFDALETLAVAEAARRLYVISGGRLYVASLP